jgi:hypothetical protein
MFCTKREMCEGGITMTPIDGLNLFLLGVVVCRYIIFKKEIESYYEPKEVTK